MKTSVFMNSIVVVLIAAVIYAFPQAARGSEGSNALSEKQITYDPPNTEVHWELNADGSDWNRLYASGEADLKFGDNTDVRIAKKTATLRAKAEIAKFLKEKISTDETLENITKECMHATAKQNGVDENATRNVVSTLIEKVSSHADALLKGVIVLEERVDTNAKTVKVTVGMSKKSIGVASHVVNSIRNGGELNSGRNSAAPKSGVTTTRNIMYDKF